MFTDARSKIKIGILIFLTIITYFFGATVISDNITEIRMQGVRIENINHNVSILVLVSNRIYGIDDQITSKLLKNREFSKETSQISIFKDGLIKFSPVDSSTIDSLMKLKSDNIKMYREDSLACGDANRYLVENMSINIEIRKILKNSIEQALDENNQKLKVVVQEYNSNYKKYIVHGAVIIVVFLSLGFLLIKDLAKLVRSNDRSKSTINDLLIYIKSLRK